MIKFNFSVFITEYLFSRILFHKYDRQKVVFIYNSFLLYLINFTTQEMEVLF